MKAMLEPRMVAAKTHLPFGAWGKPFSFLESGPAGVILIGMDTVRCGHDIRRCHAAPDGVSELWKHRSILPEWPAIRKSYKKECQEKNLPHRLNAAPCLGIQP